MAVSIREESDYVYHKMEKLGCRAVNEVANEVAKINHALTPREAREWKKKACDNFLQLVENEFTSSSELEIVRLLRKSFEIRIFCSPLLEKEIACLQTK